ncbi:hypothetical protein [Flavobacterium sp. J27]|uniref:hypothetical protein n=1 Tax=Flavobacterium sp. J27 TaxID=2060419 RepID=UPI00103173B5|nr:hypothetical protein [Flavobacterium sp. J27]
MKKKFIFSIKKGITTIFLFGFFSSTLLNAQNNIDENYSPALNDTDYHQVMARKNAEDTIWKTYIAKTIDKLPDFNYSKDPKTNKYGSWKTFKSKPTGFFRTEKIDNRWWIIDPEGNPFIHKGVAVLSPGTSENQQKVFASKYQNRKNWITKETTFFKENGFNGAGAWSDVESIRDINKPLVYTVIVSPMGAYKAQHLKKFNGEYEEAGWQGYRFDLVMVFDSEFDVYLEKEISKIEKYKNDNYLLGYFTDNELPWVDDALDRHLTKLGKDEAGYLAAKHWLNQRKGKEATIADVTDEDRLEFTGFYFETYMKKVTEVIKKYDKNHMYLGCRFNQELDELDNPKIFEVAGKYMDIVSVNHYRKWEPVPSILENWMNWSTKPFIITEWYTKGEDSGLPNKTGAGWNVPTQKDRGYFYQNFVIELLKSKGCVGWHWFKYQDNDPSNLKTDYSNRDSNKGIIDSEFNYYRPLMENMKMMNSHVYELIQYLDSKN